MNSKNYNFYVYQFIREHGGFENWQMIQVEEYPCNNKREAESRETFWMKELNSTLNSNQSFRTEEKKKEQLQEWRENNKEYIKKYRENNIEYYKEYNKEYRKTDKRKEYQREYEKTDKRKEYQREYKKEYQKTDKRKEYQREYKKQQYQQKALYLNELKCYNII